jgi:tetraacyldisaccharide 4'-kinase
VSNRQEKLVAKVWYGHSRLRWALLPLAWLYQCVTAVRRTLYRIGIFRSLSVGVPVIVIGNITAGGTGKTPVTIWLSQALRQRGWRPGIVSRGYRGSTGAHPVKATRDSDPQVVGDEALLMARKSGCPVVVHPDRVAAARKLVQAGVDVVLADDGLQHYRLARDYEIAVVDGTRGLGNGCLLPAGPLREPPGRLTSVDCVLVQRESAADMSAPLPLDREILGFHLEPGRVERIDGSGSRTLEEFSGSSVHAVAGIGHPERFFRMLERHGIRVKRHPLADHAAIDQSTLDFDDDDPVFMTEKDAVKCGSLATGCCWYIDVDIAFTGGGADVLLDGISSRLGGAPRATA